MKRKDVLSRQMLSRYLFLVSGVVMFSLAGLLFYRSSIGMDPLSVLYTGVSEVLHIRLGTTEILVGAVVLLALLFLDRKRIGLGTVAVVAGIGPLLNLFLDLFAYTPSGWIGKILFSLAGVVVYGFAMAFYLHSDLGCGPVDGLMLYLSERAPVSLRTFKILFDVLCVIIGGLLGGSLGVGTVMAALLSGPAMCAVMKLLGDEEGSAKAKKGDAPHETGLSDRAG